MVQKMFECSCMSLITGKGKASILGGYYVGSQSKTGYDPPSFLVNNMTGGDIEWSHGSICLACIPVMQISSAFIKRLQSVKEQIDT